MHCHNAAQLGKGLFQASKISWVMQASTMSMLSEFIRAFGKDEKARVLRKCSVTATFWVFWIERSRRIFEDSEEDIIYLWERVRLLASLWASVTK